jgi:hypothetical protein
MVLVLLIISMIGASLSWQSSNAIDQDNAGEDAVWPGNPRPENNREKQNLAVNTSQETTKK